MFNRRDAEVAEIGKMMLSRRRCEETTVRYIRLNLLTLCALSDPRLPTDRIDGGQVSGFSEILTGK